MQAKETALFKQLGLFGPLENLFFEHFSSSFSDNKIVKPAEAFEFFGRRVIRKSVAKEILKRWERAGLVRRRHLGWQILYGKNGGEQTGS